MRFSFLVALPLPLAATVAQAQRSAPENIDASKLPDSGPLITGGSGATAGPNSKNQAVSPMPGTSDQQLSERPRDEGLPPPPVRALPGAPVGRPPAPVTPSR